MVQCFTKGKIPFLTKCLVVSVQASIIRHNFKYCFVCFFFRSDKLFPQYPILEPY